MYLMCIQQPQLVDMVLIMSNLLGCKGAICGILIKCMDRLWFVFSGYCSFAFIYYIFYRRMFRSIPVSNKLCFDKDVKRSWKIHEAKLNCLKGSVGKQRPERFDFLGQRLKKVALQQVRNMEVDRENHALLKKIKQIESKGCKTSYTRMYHDLSESKKKTLNEPYRKRELLKIVEQNQDIMRRLQNKRSEYDIRRMERQRKQIEKNISLISDFPYKRYPFTHTPVNLWATTDKFAQQLAPPPSELDFAFKGERVVEDLPFAISTYLSKGSFYLEMEGVEDRRERYRIELPEQKARDLLRISYNGNIEKMLEGLSIDRTKQVCFLRYSPAIDV